MLLELERLQDASTLRALACHAFEVGTEVRVPTVLYALPGGCLRRALHIAHYSLYPSRYPVYCRRIVGLLALLYDLLLC